MDNFRIAVKSFIINKENCLLIIKRVGTDPHSPGVWEIPGGRLELGEDPIEGLKRETKEETGLEIEVKNPLKVQHFTRDDGQKITMIIFLCSPLSESVNLSEEHEKYEWKPLNELEGKLHPKFMKEVETFKKYFSKK